MAMMAWYSALSCTEPQQHQYTHIHTHVIMARSRQSCGSTELWGCYQHKSVAVLAHIDCTICCSAHAPNHSASCSLQHLPLHSMPMRGGDLRVTSIRNYACMTVLLVVKWPDTCDRCNVEMCSPAMSSITVHLFIHHADYPAG
eukprot:scpid105287/ scgid21790/ 